MMTFWWILVPILLGLISWLTFRPTVIQRFESHPKPVISYDEAVARVKSLQDADNEELPWDVCVTKLFDHGKQTEHGIILLHGFTNCPEQFTELGKQYFEAGYNVFIPRMPHHGLSDRLTEALVDFTAEKLAAFGDDMIDVAHGLGKKITVVGISGSGTLVAWLAQNRSDLDYAFAIAPLFGLSMIPSWFTRLFERLALLLPNFYMWWDPRTKANNPLSIYYAYPRYPWRALAEILRLAMVVRAEAEKSPPAVKHITLIINDAEPAVSNAEILKLLGLWRKHGVGNLNEHHFEKDMQLPHDIITPGVYGALITDLQPRLMGVVRDVHMR